MQNVTLNVQGMTCGHCVKAVQGAVEEAGAICTVVLVDNIVTVTYDETKVSLETIKEAIEEQGYDVI
jgi:copper chaperone